ncbi:MAG: aminotransferase class V-fold PLP-dependent enzyme [Candidatus Buchananbacteria bacterium]|jgi:cysteine desulfurase
MKQIYLDNSATTPLDSRVLKEMMPYLTEIFGNASSIHQVGNDAMKAVMDARGHVAKFLNCPGEEIYFTSGATESDNIAVLGLVRAIVAKNPDIKPHIIVSAIEHEAVLEPARALVKEGKAELSYLPVDNSGIVDPEALKKLIKPNTALVSVMIANNEIGTIQPIMELGRVIEEFNQGRKQKIYFHTDATQALAYVECDVKNLKVDLLSLSGHKIYGPKGVGVLFIKKGTPIYPLAFGGGQEKKIRSGTYNVPGIVGLGKAVELIADKKTRMKSAKDLKVLRDYCAKQIIKKIPKTRINGDMKNRLPNNVNFTLEGVEGESVILMLSQKGIMASTGSACSSGSLDPSHVLLAIGLPAELAHGSLRITLGKQNKKSDINALIKALPPIVEKLRKMSPLKIK